MKKKLSSRSKTVIIGTRASQLALTQSNWIRRMIKDAFPDLQIKLKRIVTSGDRFRDRSLAEIGGKGLFTKEIEEAMLRGEIDIAVHSLKDVPTLLPEGLVLGAITKREMPWDTLLWNDNYTPNRKTKQADMARAVLQSLPQKALVGTSSLRRQAQLLALRPDLRIIPLRGNLPTRIRKLNEKEFDAIILARAGLNRLHINSDNTAIVPKEVMLPAIGQGAVAIECRADDTRILGYLKKLHHNTTAQCVIAERAFLESLGGGCQYPIAALAEIKKQKMTLEGLIITPDGKKRVQGKVNGSPGKACQLGQKLGKQLLSRGGNLILKQLSANSIKKRAGIEET